MYDESIGQFMQADPIENDVQNLHRYCRNDPTNATDPSGLRECDDRETPKTKNLKNIEAKLQCYVNTQLKELWDMCKRQGFSADVFVDRVYQEFGRSVVGSGVKKPIVGEVARLAKIAFWFEKDLSEESGEIAHIKYSDSRYAAKEPGGGITAEPIWLYNEETAQHGLAPTVRIRGTLMGTDKWEHFFKMGYWVWYWSNNSLTHGRKEYTLDSDKLRYDFCYTMEDLYCQEDYDKLLTTEGDLSSMKPRYDAFMKMMQKFEPKVSHGGYFGATSTGVISNADIKANLEGYRFYKKLYESYEKDDFSPFAVSDYNTKRLNEAVETKNKYTGAWKFGKLVKD